MRKPKVYKAQLYHFSLLLQSCEADEETETLRCDGSRTRLQSLAQMFHFQWEIRNNYIVVFIIFEQSHFFFQWREKGGKSVKLIF